MDLTATDSNTAPPPQRRGLRVFLIVIALIETVGSLTNLPGVFGGGLPALGSGFGKWIIAAGLAILPVPSIAALVFAIKGRLDRAIMAIAVIVLVIWISYLPTVIALPAQFAGSGLSGAYDILQMVVFPLLAVTAITLVLRTKRLALAAFLVSIPTIVGVVVLVAFTIGVAIYGS